MKQAIKRVWRVVKIVMLLLFLAVLTPNLVALGGVAISCAPSRGGAAQPDAIEQQAIDRRADTADIRGYARPEDQTYLTLPEWYIVYSSDEYAAFIQDNPPSQFPYFGAIGQYWGSYYDVCGITRDRYEFNGRYHITLAVIGVSFTTENIIKGIYENTIGRLTELVSSRALSAEDAYARSVAAEYGMFLHTIPWYQFPFRAKLSGLWAETPLWGPNIIRKAERKGALTAEYGSKAIYGWLIKQGTQSAYDPQDLEIHVWAEGITPELMQREPTLTIVKPIDSQAAIVKLPRYEAFTQTLPGLARQGVRFVEIAGNDEILLTLIAPKEWEYTLDDGQFLFTMPILTQPERQRMAVRVPVWALHEIIRDLDSQQIVIEHIYDY